MSLCVLPWSATGWTSPTQSARRSSPTSASQPAWSRRTPRSGAPRPRARRRPARLAGPAGELAAAGQPAGGAAGRARRRGPRPDRAVRDGRVVAGAGGHLRHGRRPARRARHHRPGPGAAAMADLDRTVVVVSSKSGGTVETDSQRRAFISAFADGRPGREGDRRALRRRHRPRLAAVGGRRGDGRPRGVPRRPDRRRPLQRALGVRPGALGAGRRRRRRAARRRRGAGRARWPRRTTPRCELGVALGAAFGPAATSWRWPTAAPAMTGFGDWAEQLIAESTGKEGRGILPVVLESVDAPGSTADDVLLAVVGRRHAPPPGPRSASPAARCAVPRAGSTPPRWPAGSWGSTPSTSRTSPRARRTPPRILDEGLPDEQPAATIGAIEVRGSGGVLDGVDLSSHDGVSWRSTRCWRRSRRAATSRVMAYLDRQR